MAQDDFLTGTVERNRYFYRKFMTARDFVRDQEYFNGKRWMINRLLFGSGIVCGLDVKPGDSATSVFIEPGLAFDPSGHEVTVTERTRVDLATVPGGVLPGGSGASQKNLLVCLTYRECPKEPVPSFRGSPCDEVCESNRIGETFTVSLIDAAPDPPPPSACENWLNRQTVARESDKFDTERVAPVWVRPGEVFEVAVKVTARADVVDAQLTETVSGGAVIEPSPVPPPQFPTPPVDLRKGEFFVYVYQVRASAPAGGSLTISGGAGVPTNPTSVLVVNEQEAARREGDQRLAACAGEQPGACVPVAKVLANFNGQTLSSVQVLNAPKQKRFIYSLARVAELMDCVRSSIQAETGSQRPGHAFITFKDLEQNDLQPIGPTPSHGNSFTVTRGDHVHALLLYKESDGRRTSGLQFNGNRLRINGDVGGEKIRFLHTVSGESPLNPEHLATKGYVDSRIAGLDWQESVISKKLTAPPDNPATGDRYLILEVKREGLLKPNPWSGHVGAIATYNKRTKKWEFAPDSGEPDGGTAVFVEDEKIAYLFVKEPGASRGAWIPFLATPEIAAGRGLLAEGAVISVGDGPGLQVNKDNVEVVFEKAQPQPVGPEARPGAINSTARGDHTHALPLAPLSGLQFGLMRLPPIGLPDNDLPLAERPNPELPVIRAGLHINGPVGGANIDFRHAVWGQDPTEPRHLATKQYVDRIAAGLDWQNSVLDKDLKAPPFRIPRVGARYLILATGPIRFPFPEPIPGPFPPSEPTPLPESLRREATDLRLTPTEGETEERVPTESREISSPPDITFEPPTEELPTRPLPPEPEPVPIPRPLPEPGPLPPLPINPWAGHEGSITTWDGSAWTFNPPNEGMAVFVEDENTAYIFVDGKWVAFMTMPPTAAGQGLRADGAVLSVGQGRGLRVNPDDVDVVYHQTSPATVGPSTSPGVLDTAARGDHTHELPLERDGGLEFSLRGREEEESTERTEGATDETAEIPLPKPEPGFVPRLRVNGPLNGDRIDFRRPVLGQDPVEPRHLATKRYVDTAVAGLTWQRPVLDRDLTEPPSLPERGDRYLILTEKPGGDWKANPLNIATWNGTRWDFTAPAEGMATFVADENLAYLFVDGRWGPFLAPPPAIGAGAGLIFAGGDLAVGRGDGSIIVNDDSVSVSFGDGPPPPVSTSGRQGQSLQAAQSDHTHELPLADMSGLEFSATPTNEEFRPIPVPRLRVNGPVGGSRIDFLSPVLGQDPVDPRHLATKQYVDSKNLSTEAGAGLVSKENVISVGNGPGLIVAPDEVAVNFENNPPPHVSLESSSPGVSNTAARGDHTHAMPDIWGQSAATGVLTFSLEGVSLRQVASHVIDPGFGGGPFSVVVGLESDFVGEGLFIGQVDQFESSELTRTDFPPMPPVNLGVNVMPPGERSETKNHSFQIWAHVSGKAESLPQRFRVRWWAYRPGRDYGELEVVVREVEGGTVVDPKGV